eukprot:629499-Pleurochrysis_carterae.AAC.1
MAAAMVVVAAAAAAVAAAVVALAAVAAAVAAVVPMMTAINVARKISSRAPAIQEAALQTKTLVCARCPSFVVDTALGDQNLPPPHAHPTAQRRQTR